MKQILRYALSMMLVAAPLGVYAEGNGSQDNPYTAVWFDNLSINGPGAAASPSDYTFYEVTCRAEGVMMITNNTNAHQIALIKNGVQIINSIAKNGAQTSILVKMGDIITFKMISQDDQSGKTIDLAWRAAKAGEEWNGAIELAQGPNTIPAIKNNIDLAQWYKFRVPANATATLTMGQGVAMVFTADNAAGEMKGSTFTNTEDDKMVYVYENKENRQLDLYVKVSAMNNECSADLSYGPVVAENGDGSQENPYIIAWDAESFNAPAADTHRTYYQLTSNYEGVMHIDADAIDGDFISDLYVNGVRRGNGVTRDILVNRGDVILFTYMCRKDNSANAIKLSYRSVAEGEIWNMPVIMNQGDNATSAVKNNVDLAKWYKVSVPAQAKMTLTMPYAEAMVYTVDQAAKENRGSAFENTEDGIVYTYNNLEGRIVDLYVKVSAQNAEGNANVAYSAAEQPKGNGTEDEPYIVAWDAEGFNAPAAGAQKTYYQIVSNYEGVMAINTAAIKGATMSDLVVNGVRVGNVVTREILINRGDVVTFAVACQEDNSENQIALSYRPVAEGEVWNMPVALAEGENEVAAVKQNIDLAQWYKVAVPAGAKLTLTMPYGVAMAYTADTAAGEKRGSQFENTEAGMVYTYNNRENRIVDIYVKVEAMNEAGKANVLFAAAEQSKGNGTEEDPYILAWDAEGFNAPAAGYAKTYYQLDSNFSGVMQINTDAIKGATMTDLIVNGVRVGNVATREILIERHDIVTFAIACQEDNSENQVKLAYRAVAEGDVWNMPFAAEESFAVPVIKNNIDLARWYKVSVPAGAKMTMTMGQGIAMAYTADTAAGENMGSAFENGADGTMSYSYNNNSDRIVDIYVKVSAMNESCNASVSFQTAEQPKGTGIESDPYIIAWDAEGFNAPAAGMDKTYYQLTSNYEGVMSIDTKAIIGATMSDLCINGERVGNVVTREVLVNRGDVITFALACELDNTQVQVKLAYRTVAEGEIWNMPIALAQGENDVEAVKLNIDLAKWYKVTVPAQAKMTLTMPYATAMVYTADNAASQVRGSMFENTEAGMTYSYNNNSDRTLDLYVKVDALNEAGKAVVSYEAAEQPKGTGAEDDPYIIAWDAEGFNAPAAGYAKTYYQLTSNYEGVMQINTSAIKGAMVSDLYVNGQRIGNVATREIIVNRGDVVKFAIACQEDNSESLIGLHYRTVAEGEIWNQAIALAQGENEVQAVMENINLAKWYKVSVPAQAKMTLTMPYGVAMVYTADTAAEQVRGTMFENTENGMVYAYNNIENRQLDLYIKVSAMNEAGVATVSYEAAEQPKGDGTQDNPYIVAWDAEGFNAPAAGASKTYYQLTSNYEGVMMIDASAIKGATMTDLCINGQRIGNVVTREILVKRGEVVTFAIACQEDNSENEIKLAYRQIAEGEVWNQAVAIEGETVIPVIKENINLARWYKVSVPAQAKATINMPYAVAMVYTADAAGEEARGSMFENTESGMVYAYNNLENRALDLYIKVSANNAEGVATVTYGAAEQSQGTGTEEDPYIIAWDAEGFNAPAAAQSPADKTYYQLTSNYEGVMSINTEAIQGYTMTELYINGVRNGNVQTREVLVNRGDVVTFVMVCEKDNSENQVKLAYRAVAEGDIWNMPIALAEGDNEVSAIKNNVDLAKWYKVTVHANSKTTVTLPYGIAMAYTADTAAEEIHGASFENTEAGIVYSYNNTESRELDIYIKVSSLYADGIATVSYEASEQPKGDGTQENPYILDWDAEGFNAPAAGASKTYYQLTSNYEGVMMIDASAIKGATMSDLLVNGVRMGNVVTREILINRGDIVTFAIACQEDNSENQVKVSYRPVAEGEVWNWAIALAEGENEISAIKNNIDLAKWYKVTVPANDKVTLTMGYGVAMVYTADTAAGEIKGAAFENTEKGMAYTYDNQEARDLDIYVKVSALNENGVIIVTTESVSGIDEITVEAMNGKVYDLNGIAVKQAVKGKVYIVNGKKVRM